MLTKSTRQLLYKKGVEFPECIRMAPIFEETRENLAKAENEYRWMQIEKGDYHDEERAACTYTMALSNTARAILKKQRLMSAMRSAPPKVLMTLNTVSSAFANAMTCWRSSVTEMCRPGTSSRKCRSVRCFPTRSETSAGQFSLVLFELRQRT